MTGPGIVAVHSVQLVGRAERVLGAVDEQARHVQIAAGARRAGSPACPAGAADSEISTTPATVAGGGAPSAPAATIEQIRPPIDRPADHDHGPSPMAASSSRTAASSTGGRSGARRPALRYGKSARTVVHAGATARVDGDERRLVPAGTGAGEQQQRAERRRGHQARRGVGEDLARLGQLEHRRAGQRLVAAVVGVDGAHLRAELRRDLLLRRRRRARREAEDVERPRPRVGERRQRRRVGAGEVGDQRRADGPAPAHRLVQHGAMTWRLAGSSRSTA